MKLLLDSCVWGKARIDLELAGHDVASVGDWREDPGDDEILKSAFDKGQTLITLDKDFGELAVLHKQFHSGILRLVNIPARQQASVCLNVIALHGAELQAGAIVTAEQNRIRIRLP